MNYYNLDSDEVLEKLGSSKLGLDQDEALKRLKKNGKNVLKESKKDSNWRKFFSQFRNLMIAILFVAAIVSFIVSYINNESYIDSIAILAIVFINAILGFVQELKADEAMSNLKKMQTSVIKVKRNGKVTSINSSDIVVGDILVLEAGDKVSADARVIYEASLKCDESSLTGESVSVTKSIKKIIEQDIPISSRVNMVYSGTVVTYGKCLAVVVETGMNTEFGKIAESLDKEVKEVTPIEKKINDISKFLSIIVSIIIVIMFIVGIVKKMAILEVVMLSISLAVAAIPEGLPAVITVTLSLGVLSMAKKKAIVKKLASVETLGCTQVICSDKTGTITQNKMTVVGVYYNDKLFDVKEDIDEDFLHMMILNNDVEKDGEVYIGDPTEVALYNFCENRNIDVLNLREKYLRIGELPFDSERKMMTTFNKYNNFKRVITKGSFDSVIDHCSKISVNGKINTLSLAKKKKLKEVERSLSNKAYRVLTFAFKDLKIDTDDIKEDDLVFLGMTLMIDPPREDVKDAILDCKSAGIRPIMITGDSLDTAVAVGKDIGILEQDGKAITGVELDKLTKRQLKKVVNEYSVYARVSPINKLDIVEALKENGNIVAMTGDGVNDAPALKRASIGVGMGITGTEVSKEVADIVLSDDSFSTIVVAVKEGRRIYDNIRNVLVYLITSNIAEVLIVFIGMMFGLEIFLPIQLLYINLITDSVPAIALSFEESAKDIMKRSVRKNSNSFFTPFIIVKMMSAALLKTMTVLLVYFLGRRFYGDSVAISMAFLSLILLEMVFAFSCRNLKSSVVKDGIFKNKYINISLIFLLFVQLLVFLTPIKNIFGIVDLSILQVCFCVIIVFLVFLIDELSKGLFSSIFKD